jgi:hypothetical protein
VTSINYCKDCAHMRWPKYGGISGAKCYRPNSTHDPVEGCSGHCSYERRQLLPSETDDVCGPDGKYFEPRPPAPLTFWQRLFGSRT